MDPDRTTGASAMDGSESLTGLVSRLVEDLAAARERAARSETSNEVLQRRLSTLRFECWKLRDELKRIAPEVEALIPRGEVVAQPVSESEIEPDRKAFSDAAPIAEEEAPPIESPFVTHAAPPPDLWSQEPATEDELPIREAESKKWWKRG